MNSQERNLRAEAFLEKQARIIPFSILKNIVKELKATKQLRNDIVTDAQAGSFLGNGIRYLERKNVPGAHFLSNTLTQGHKALLDADTILAAILRGKAKEDSLRYRLLTNSENFIENSALGKNIYKKVPRATLTRPLVATSSFAVPILAGMQLESYRDKEENS